VYVVLGFWGWDQKGYFVGLVWVVGRGCLFGGGSGGGGGGVSIGVGCLDGCRDGGVFCGGGVFGGLVFVGGASWGGLGICLFLGGQVLVVCFWGFAWGGVSLCGGDLGLLYIIIYG